MEFKVRNMRKLQVEIAKRGKRWPAAMAIAAYDEMVTIFQMSQEIVPVDTGKLRESGKLRRIGRKTVERFTVYYDAPHARRIHNDTSLDYARQERALSNPSMVGMCNSGIGAVGGKSYFLTTPFNNRKRGMESRIRRNTAKNEKAGRTNRRLMRNLNGKACGS